MAALGVVAAGATYATATPTSGPPSGLSAVGPVSSEHGFPVWYQDSGVPQTDTDPGRAPLRLEQCLDLEEEMCDPVFLRGEMQNPSGPMSFPDNFPMESFYMAADSSIELPGGSADLTLALEATFASDDPGPAVDEQMVFGRVRIRVDTPAAGTYTVTHPYGTDTFKVTDTDDGINYTQDIGASVMQFGDALKSRINPFLVRKEGLLVTEDGDTFIGDPAVPTQVTGSLLGTNYFKIEGPGLPAEGLMTDLFSLMGKVSTNAGIDPQRITYSESTDGKYLDVFAKADSGDLVTVSGAGIPVTNLAGQAGNFYGRIKLADGVAVPDTVTLTNASDKPVAVKTVKVVDQVSISSATYDSTAKRLTVSATTSDQDVPPALALAGFGSAVPVEGTFTVDAVPVPPASVTVTSAEGGSDTAPVMIGGDPIGDAAEVTAVATGPSTVLAGSTVMLDASSSYNATSYSWEQVANPDGSMGPVVSLDSATSMTPSFTAPAEAATLSFAVTVEGPGGPKTSEPVTITVTGQGEAPVAAATSTLSSALVGQTVTIDGSGSTNAKTFTWTQTSGAPVTFDAAAKSFSFPMPAGKDPVAFSLVVTAPDGVTQSQPVTVTVAPVLDNLSVTSAQFRSGKTEWRIEGTASLTNNNTVSVYLQNADGSQGSKIGEAAVEAAVAPETVGTWSLRTRGGVGLEGATHLIVKSTRGGELERAGFTSRR